MSEIADYQDVDKKPKTNVGQLILVIVALIGIVAFTTYAIVTSENSDSILLETVYNQDQILDSYWKSKLNDTLAKRIRIKVNYDSNNELTVKIQDADNPGFELPEDSQYFPNNKNSIDSNDGKRSYRVELSQDGKLTIYRVEDDKDVEVIFDTVGHKILVSNNYTQFGTTLNSKYLYGIGQRRKEFRYKGQGNYTTWPKDQFGTNDYGTPGKQLYGYHPMWLIKEKSDNFHIGLLKSTSPLLTEITEGERMVFHVVGGTIYLKFILGNKNPEEVIKSYHRYINGFGLHPFWAQGYHQCRWGYKNTKQMLEVIQKMTEINHPMDSIWNDLDYMTNYQVFTRDKTNFIASEMAQIVDRSKDSGVHWVPLVDIGIATGTEAEKMGNEADIFLKSSVYKKDGKPSNLEGCVWPGAVVFPDFNNPKTFEYWTNCSLLMRSLSMEPSGWWIDMNEMASFIPGERDTESNEDCYGANPPSPAPVKEKVDDRLWFPFLVTDGQPLAHKTATLNAVHYGGEDGVLFQNKAVPEQYFHSLNNLAEQIATHETLKKFTGKNLTFSLTRGSIYGSGRYTALWTGDNIADWEFLRLGVSELLSMQFFGIPLAGNDLCGFASSTNAELCAKWLAFGAWQPFSRNHNDNESISQEPYSFTETYVQTASVAAFNNRYSLLKWMYTQFVKQYEPDLGAATGTIIQPVWWNQPNDTYAYNYEDSEFLFGNTFLIAPVLFKSESPAKINVYFPKGAWIDCEDFKTVYNYNFEGKPVVRTRGFDQQALSFQKEGTAVLRQTPKLRSRLLDNVFDVWAFLNSEALAEGQILSLSDYEENNVASKCWSKDSNCIVNVSVKGTVKVSDGKFTITIQKLNGQTYYDEIGFKLRDFNIYYQGEQSKLYQFKNINIVINKDQTIELPLATEY